MKTIYILAAIVLIGAAVFAYIYNKEDVKSQNPDVVNTEGLKAPVVISANGLNPAHGLPNHRCDLPVGAPLTVTAEQKSTAPAMPKTNPQHGMPSHRCDLAVGAPL
jgi:hypothetical protein